MQVLPLVLISLELLLDPLLFFLFEFLFEFLLLLREVRLSRKHLLVLLESIDDLLIHLLLAYSVLFSPLFWSLG